MFIAERFISGLMHIHGPHPVSTDGGTWYPQASRFLKLSHHIHSCYQKSIIERTMQYKRLELNASMTIFHVEKEVN
jgi:putative transposase